MRRKLLVFLSLAALALLVYLLLRRDFDSRLFFSSLYNVRPGWIVASIAVTFACYGVRAYRWQVLLISFKRINLGSLLTTTIVGFGAIYVLGRAGEFVRPVWIARREAIPTSGSVATIAVERVFDLLMLVLLSAATLALVELPDQAQAVVNQLGAPLWLSLSGAAGALVGCIFLHSPVAMIAKRLPFRRIGQTIETFAQGVGSTSDGKKLGSVTVYSILLWLGIALQFWFMLIGLNLNLGFMGATLVLVATSLGSVAQIPGIGGGLQAACAFSLTTFFGIQAEVAVAAALLVWGISYAPTVIVGAAYMMWKGISTRELAVEGTQSA